MKYGVAIFPSKNLQDKANSFRKRYDPHYSLLPPHITLKEAFDIDEDKVDELVSKIRKIAEKNVPVTIKVDRVSSFHPVNNVIYLKVEHNESIDSLHTDLHKEELENNQQYNFVPHITIAQKLSDQEFSDVLESLKMKDFHHEEKVDRFQLLYQLENGSWTVYETFHLGGNQ